MYHNAYRSRKSLRNTRLTSKFSIWCSLLTSTAKWLYAVAAGFDSTAVLAVTGGVSLPDSMRHLACAVALERCVHRLTKCWTDRQVLPSRATLATLFQPHDHCVYSETRRN